MKIHKEFTITEKAQETFKGEIECTVLPNHICFLTNHNNFHVADIQLLLLSSNQNTVVHKK